MRSNLTLGVMAFAMGVVLTSCGSTPTAQEQSYSNASNTNMAVSTASGTTMNSTSSDQFARMQTALPQKGEDIAIIETSMGTIKMKFFPKEAPNTVNNFMELARKDFYNGLLFHRVIKDFMIQGGDPEGNGTGGKTFNGAPLMDEISPNVKHVYGAVSMANRGPNTASSQFFIVQNKDGAGYLDGGYTVFGQVYEGMDIVDAIASVDRVQCAPYERKTDCDKPLKDVKMMKVTIAKAE